MKRQITFNHDNHESFANLTKDYFAKAGFRLIVGTSHQISFSKGSILLNMVTFNPLNWKSKVTVTVTNGLVVADFDINTTGQLTTPEEEKLWDAFIENYKSFIIGKLDLTAENQRHLKETRKNNWKYLKWALFGAVAVGVPSGFLAPLTENDSLAPMGAVIGAMLFVTFRINRERRNNA